MVEHLLHLYRSRLRTYNLTLDGISLWSYRSDIIYETKNVYRSRRKYFGYRGAYPVHDRGFRAYSVAPSTTYKTHP